MNSVWSVTVSEEVFAYFCFFCVIAFTNSNFYGGLYNGYYSLYSGFYNFYNYGFYNFYNFYNYSFYNFYNFYYTFYT